MKCNKSKLRAEGLSKLELRYIVAQVMMIDTQKLFKMNKEKLINIVSEFTLLEIRDLLK